MSSMTSALKAGAGLLGLSMMLASCGSSSVAPDGSASLRISDVRTEYKTADGTYVACDNVSQLDGSITHQTAVATYFNVAGTINSLTVNLKGVTTPQYDGFYTKTINGGDLPGLGNGNYRLIFFADNTDGAYLPQSFHAQGIIVTPTTPTVKLVTTSNQVGTNKDGRFYSAISVDTGTASFTANSRNLRTVPVFSGCNVQAAQTGETL